MRSIMATAVLGGLGIAWGLAVGSQMILLDGIYSIVGIMVSLLLLRASAAAAQGPSSGYPYGREALTPLVIGIQGFVLLGTLTYAAVEAVYTILDGGSDVEAGLALVYGVVTTTASAGVWWRLRRVAGASDLLVSEGAAWRVGTLRSAGMIVGFGLILVLADSSWQGAAAYVDPVMVLLTCVLFLGAPIGMVRLMIAELLEAAPDPELLGAVTSAVDAAGTAHGVDSLTTRVTKVGPKLYVEVEGTVAETVTIADEERVRQMIGTSLEALPYPVWLTIELRPSSAHPAEQ
jgi:predicted Co/Zn/Cd cation transporter (cation efflux family)